MKMNVVNENSQKLLLIKTSSMLFSILLVTIGLTTIGANQIQAQKLDVIPANDIAALLAEAANLDQCRNGGVGEPAVPCNGSGGGNVGYVNGNAGAENAHYTEGDSIPYRIRFSGLTVGSSNTVVIEYDTTEQGKHAIDYLTSYDRTETIAMGNDPCSDVLTVAECSQPFNNTFNSTFPIPIDPMARNQIPGVFTCFGCTITAVSGYTYTGDFSGTSTASLTVTFTANVSNPILAFGGHIATRSDWGSDSSASTIPGSPYHMRVLRLNGASTGNQDRSLNSRAVALIVFAPTAAKLNVSGRVMSGKRGIANAEVLLTNQTGETVSVRTNAFGHYRFKDVAAGQTYVFNVFAKRFQFTPQVITISEEMTELNFSAEQ